MKLSNAQWDAIRDCFPAEEFKQNSKGGRLFVCPRAVLEGVLWVMRTGAPWSDLPSRYPSYQTCHRRFQRWVKLKVMPRVLARLRNDLEERGGGPGEEAFIVYPYKKRDLAWVEVAAGWPSSHGNSRPPWFSTRYPYCRRKQIRLRSHRRNSRCCFLGRTTS